MAIFSNLQSPKCVYSADSKQVEHKYMQDDYKMEQLKSSMSKDDKFYESMSTIHQKHSKNMFAIGLNAKDSCVLSIKVKPSCLDMNDPVAVSDRTSKILIGISTISNTIKVDLQINSYDKFTLVIVDKFNNTLLGMDTALRIITTLNRLNAQYEKNGETPFEICIGVASGQCLQGNIGNKSVRYFSNIGDVVKRADDMCTMSYILDVPIIVDNQSMKLSQNSFVFKPVDRYASESKVETIFELVKSSHVENDEWLYELEQKKQNAKFAQLNECFKRLFECNETLDETEVRAARQQMIDIGADDRIIGRFVELLDKVQDSKDLESLRSSVRTRIESMLQNCELVVI